MSTSLSNSSLSPQQDAASSGPKKVIRSTVTCRVELRIILDFISKGDTLVVTRIDCLARSLGCRSADVVRGRKVCTTVPYPGFGRLAQTKQPSGVRARFNASLGV